MRFPQRHSYRAIPVNPFAVGAEILRLGLGTR